MASRRSATRKPVEASNLYRAIGSIGGSTMVSRVLGFARDMIGRAVLGASHANDAFNLAFLLPNIFRRLFAEGAFSSGFVPLFSPACRWRATMSAGLSNDFVGVYAGAAGCHCPVCHLHAGRPVAGRSRL
jgi:peptidoglycan biosynthesis protein MviN/MurJ (putative lipid II flippase)